jgi:hypothetical protein
MAPILASFGDGNLSGAPDARKELEANIVEVNPGPLISTSATS